MNKEEWRLYLRKVLKGAFGYMPPEVKENLVKVTRKK